MSEYIVREIDCGLATKQEIVGELVRCSDCKYHELYEEHHTCEWHGFADVKPDWYCADGESKATVEVVRCKDCQFSCTPEWDSDEVFCTKHDNWFKINGYCHLGRRKDDELV